MASGVEESGELEPAVAIRRAHHGNLDALIAQSSDTSCPFSFDRGPPFELEAEFSKEINCLSEIIDDDSYVIHSFERHASNLHNIAHSVLASGRVHGRYNKCEGECSKAGYSGYEPH